MADVYAVFGTLLALGIAFPGMLTAWWLLLPEQIYRAEQRVAQAPWRCLGAGIGVGFPIAILASLLLALPLGVFKFLGASLTVFTLGFASLGAAGIVARMAKRLRSDAAVEVRSARDFILAAVALELAAVFPIIGWFLAIPVTLLVALGASTYGVFGRRPAPAELPQPKEPALSHG
jgi:hypothetical protein